MTGISVVVTHYEQHDDLARTLACLRRQGVPPAEVVVSDDGSAVAPEPRPGVRVVTQPDRGFRAALARNRGAAATSGDVLVFLDADTWPEPDFLRAIAEPLRAEPDLLVVGRRRHLATGALAPLDGGDGGDPLAGAGEHELPEPRWLRDGWRDTDDLRAGDDASYRFVISAALACRREWWERVGGFDEGFDAYGGEDWELAHRWWVAGGRLRHVPEAVAWHHGPDAAGRGDAADLERATTESIAVARRVHAAPSAFRGLLGAPAGVVVTHDPSLDARELVVSVDGLLAQVPQAVVLSDHPVWHGIADPRVRAPGDAAAERAVLGVHLHRGVRAAGGEG